MKQALFSILLCAVAISIAACTDASAPATSSSAPVATAAAASPASSKATAGQRLVQAAEAAHHCAGEEPTDEKRRQEIERCVEENLAEARRLLPHVRAEDLPPGVLAVVRLYVERGLTREETRRLCDGLPAGDVMEGLLDEEVRAATCSLS